MSLDEKESLKIVQILNEFVKSCDDWSTAKLLDEVIPRFLSVYYRVTQGEPSEYIEEVNNLFRMAETVIVDGSPLKLSTLFYSKYNRSLPWLLDEDKETLKVEKGKDLAKAEAFSGFSQYAEEKQLLEDWMGKVTIAEGVDRAFLLLGKILFTDKVVPKGYIPIKVIGSMLADSTRYFVNRQYEALASKFLLEVAPITDTDEIAIKKEKGADGNPSISLVVVRNADLSSFTPEYLTLVPGTEAFEKAVLEDYKNAVPFSVMSQKFHVSIGSLYAIIDRHYTRSSSRVAKRVAHILNDPQKVSELIADYTSNKLTNQQLYDKYDLYKNGMYYILDFYNVPRTTKKKNA